MRSGFAVGSARTSGLVLVCVISSALAWLAVRTAVQAQERPPLQTFSVHAHKYVFEPARIEVAQDDLVKVIFQADDIPHSFTIDAYRISKRAAAGQTVTFEFRADQPGRFPFYCDLRLDDGCRKMRGELVVSPR